jgi:integrase
MAKQACERKWMGRDSNSRPPVCKSTKAYTYENYNRKEFTAYLQNVKNQEFETADGVACSVGTWLKSAKPGEEFVKSYTKPNTYNGYLIAVNHYLDFMGQTRLALKQKRRSPDSLIIPPKVEEMQRVIQTIEDKQVKAYIALCSTVGLRPQRLLKTSWSEIDFVNGFVNINERHGKKHYTDRHKLKDLVKTKGAIRLVDPYYGLETLDILEQLDNKKRIRFLGEKRSGNAGTFSREIINFRNQFTNIELRRHTVPHDLHDRYIITDEALILVGHGIKDLGERESFVAILKGEMGKEIKKDLIAKFDQRWSTAQPI